MKPLKELTSHLLQLRLSQPKATLAQAQSQATRVMASTKHPLSSEEANLRTIELLKEDRFELEKKLVTVFRDMDQIQKDWQIKWENLLKSCCDAEAEVQHLQNIVENLNFLVADVNENNSHLIEEVRKLTAIISGTKIINTRVAADYETRISTLAKELKTTEDNRKYACDHINQQNILIRDAKLKMESLWQENENLVQSKVNGAHLAKKTVELHQDNVRLMQENSEAKNQLAETKAILEQTCKNLAKANKESDIIQHNWDVQYEESLKLLTAKQRERGHLYEIITMQRDALEIIARGAMFKHSTIAHVCLKNVMTYKEKNNLV